MAKTIAAETLKMHTREIREKETCDDCDEFVALVSGFDRNDRDVLSAAKSSFLFHI